MARGASFAYNYLLSSVIELSAPPSPQPRFVPFDLAPMEKDAIADASLGQPMKPRQLSRDQLGFSFDEPVFTPIIPDIHIVEPSTPDDSRNSSEEHSNGFVEVEPVEDDEEKALDAEDDQEKEKQQEGEIKEDMTVSSSPLNRRHAIRPADQMTPTNVDDEVPGVQVLNRILTKPNRPVAPPNPSEEIPPSSSILLPPENNEMTIEQMPTVQFTPEVILQHELQEAAAAAAAANRRFWDNCCSLM